MIVGAVLIALGWLIGRACNDRFHWSQWLWWIPTPLAIACILAGLTTTAGAFARARIKKSMALAWIIGGAMTVTYFALIEHKILRRPVPPPAADTSIKVVHWNAQPPRWQEVEPTIELVRRLQADVIVLTDPGGLLHHERSQEFIKDGLQVASAYPFAMITRLPIITLRQCVAVDGMHVTLVECDATDRLKRRLTVYLVDLPSNPQVPRMGLARRLRAMLDKQSLPPPDLVVGDLNIPRGSASLTTLFPLMHHAFDEAGHGYGATFPRQRPLWHVDHVLFAYPLQVQRYELIDPGRSRHRLQMAWISEGR